MKIHLLWPLALLAGCASAAPVTIATDHPASPDAPSAALPTPSQTLALSNSPPSSAPAPAPSAHSAHDAHAGHSEHGAATTTTAREPATTRSAALYTCPHHPEVSSDKPGKCPKCKMKLVKKEPRQ